MNKRLRKKKKLREYSQYCFKFEIKCASDTEAEQYLDLIIELCERSKLSCFGGWNADKNYQISVFIVGIRYFGSSFIPSQEYLKIFQHCLIQQFFGCLYQMSSIFKENQYGKF